MDHGQGMSTYWLRVDENMIELVLEDIANESICIQSGVVDADIKRHVQSCLVADSD